MQIPIIGQEAICPDGLGRVVAFKSGFPSEWIKIDTYVDNRGCEWAPHNVELIDPRNHRAEE
jgi:hypothetical protein